MRRSRFAGALRVAARVPQLRPAVVRIAAAREGGPIWSLTLRSILERHYGVELGSYSYGPIEVLTALPSGTKIGNYCSIAANIQVLRRNHPASWVSQHPIFFNHRIGLVSTDRIPAESDNPLRIGNDVWIGHAAIIAPGCQTIGNSAIVAAGAVVAKDVAPFAIVGGIPAKFIRQRVPNNIRDLLEKSQWWLRSLQELGAALRYFDGPLTEDRTIEFCRAIAVKDPTADSGAPLR